MFVIHFATCRWSKYFNISKVSGKLCLVAGKFVRRIVGLCPRICGLLLPERWRKLPPTDFRSAVKQFIRLFHNIKYSPLSVWKKTLTQGINQSINLLTCCRTCSFVLYCLSLIKIAKRRRWDERRVHKSGPLKKEGLKNLSLPYDLHKLCYGTRPTLAPMP